MTEDIGRSENRPDGPADKVRLDSWKEIAAYLRRDVTTVRRWEKREGLPVHRHLHERRDSVYAYPKEIDDWWQGRRNRLAETGAGEEPSREAEDGRTVPLALETRSDQPSRQSRLLRVWPLAAIVALAAFGLSGGLFSPRALPRATALRFAIYPPDESSFGTVALSPDGLHVAFTAAVADGRRLLWVRPLDSLDAHSLPETDGATFPFWSPASDALGFFAAGKLWTVDIEGGSPRVVCDAPEGYGGTWNRDGVIVFAPTRWEALSRVPAAGGTPTAVTTLEAPGERGHIWPEFLPNGRRFLYLADSAAPEPHGLYVGALDNSERTLLVGGATSNAMYAHEGYLIFARGRQLLAQPFDADTLRLNGEPTVLADEVLQQWDLVHKTDFSLSNTGSLVVRSIRDADAQLVWRDRHEGQTPLVPRPAAYTGPTLSPDETRVAVDIFNLRPSHRFGFGASYVTSDIWLLDSVKGTASQFTSDPGAEFNPLWSADGSTIVFSSNRSGTLDLYQKQVDGKSEEELLLASNRDKHVTAWSPDGRYLVYVSYDEKTKQDLWLLPLIGERTPTPLLRDEYSQEQVHIAPDGRWFAYASDESGTGRFEVFVRNFPAADRRWQISTHGGGDPRWRPDGKELFYIADDRRLMAVPVHTGATFAHGAATPLFDTGMQPSWGAARNHYDVSRDGKRFLFMVPAADDRSSPFTFVLNWSGAMRQN